MLRLICKIFSNIRKRSTYLIMHRLMRIHTLVEFLINQFPIKDIIDVFCEYIFNVYSCIIFKRMFLKYKWHIFLHDSFLSFFFDFLGSNFCKNYSIAIKLEYGVKVHSITTYFNILLFYRDTSKGL